jgi:parallel beta-helix repeat protein
MTRSSAGVLAGRVRFATLVLTVTLLVCSDVVAATRVVTSTIQAAVDDAEPGDTIVVPPGIYRENVRIGKSGLTIQGSTAAILDGEGLPESTGIRVAPVPPATHIDGFTLRGLTVRNYRRTGVLLLRTRDYSLERTVYVNNDEYGPFPIFSTRGIIAFNHVSGSNDAGIYIGRSTDASIHDNIITNNTAGIQIENCQRIEVVENVATRNTLGIVVLVNPFATMPATADVDISANRVIDNNRPNPVTEPGELLARLPTGIGVLNLAGDRVAISRNTVMQHASAGIAVGQLPPDLAAAVPSVDPWPDAVTVVRNVVLENGAEPDAKLAPLPGADLLWDGSGDGNCWRANVAMSTFPELPQCDGNR